MSTSTQGASDWEEAFGAEAPMADVVVDDLLIYDDNGDGFGEGDADLGDGANSGFDADIDLEQLSAYILGDAVDGITPASPPSGAGSSDADDIDLPEEWAEHLLILEAKGDEMDVAVDQSDHLARRRAKNRISARLSRERKKQTLSALETRLENLADIERLLDEQLKLVLAQNIAMRKDMLDLEPHEEENALIDRREKRAKLGNALAERPLVIACA